MSLQSRTHKQIAERYKGNLGYYKKKLSWRIARICVGFLAIAGGLIGVVLFHKHGAKSFFNPGPISSKHARFGNDCERCHDPALAPAADATPANFWQVMGDRFQRGVTFKGVDRKCETCHTQHSFHEPSVVENRSCSACHLEHQGSSAMKAVASQSCASCHNNRDIMQASAQKGMQLPKSAFHLRAELAQGLVFDLPRPAEGYTQVFSSFASGHPEFQFAREKARDPNVLRFNHKRHLEEDIPLVNDKELTCNYCHQPGGDGRYMQKISFAANCQACHALQFDVRNPELTLPHGDPAAVRVFLQTLPSQYEALALKKGKTNPEEVRTFAATQMAQLRDSAHVGKDLERQIFFTTDSPKPQPEQTPPARSSFKGCAYCHEVKPSPPGPPLVTKPAQIDRWMPHGYFNHAKHASVSCKDCHEAAASQETPDILVPVKANCVSCHSPAGKVGSECILCHSYHATPPAATVAQSGATISFKQMLLGP